MLGKTVASQLLGLGIQNHVLRLILLLTTLLPRYDFSSFKSFLLIYICFYYVTVLTFSKIFRRCCSKYLGFQWWKIAWEAITVACLLMGKWVSLPSLKSYLEALMTQLANFALNCWLWNESFSNVTLSSFGWILASQLILLRIFRLEVEKLIRCLEILREAREDIVSIVGWHLESLNTCFQEFKRYMLLISIVFWVKRDN